MTIPGCCIMDCGKRFGWFSEIQGHLICEDHARSLAPALAADLAAWDAKGICLTPSCDKAKGHLGSHGAPSRTGASLKEAPA